MTYGLFSHGEDAYGVDDLDDKPPIVFIGLPPLWNPQQGPGLRVHVACNGNISIADLLALLNRPFDKDPHGELLLRLRTDAGLSWTVNNGLLEVKSP